MTLTRVSLNFSDNLHTSLRKLEDIKFLKLETTKMQESEMERTYWSFLSQREVL